MIDINIKRAKTNPKIFVNNIDETPKDKEDFSFSIGHMNLPPIKTVKIHLPTINLEDFNGTLYIEISEKTTRQT